MELLKREIITEWQKVLQGFILTVDSTSGVVVLHVVFLL